MAKLLRTLALAVLLAASLLALTQLWQLERQRQVYKQDMAELLHVQYGLFNMDVWSGVLADVFLKKVQQFETGDYGRDKLRVKVEGLLNRVIDEVLEAIKKDLKPTRFGLVKNAIIERLAKGDLARKQVPVYTDVVMEFLDDPENQEELKAYLVAQIDTLASQTIGKIDYSLVEAIQEAYGAESKEACVAEIEARLQAADHDREQWVWLLGAAVLLALPWVFVRRISSPELALLLTLSLALLLAGITLPMIDIDARLESLDFLLVGEPVTFTNQVVYFQSKSIFQVVGMLMEEGDALLTVVSGLIVLFSVLFPLAKILLSFAYLWRPGPLGRNAVTRFLIFKSSKWSMADVMVVAIFMAYVGFEGVINNQLDQLEESSGAMRIFSTNNSSLQPGFYLFTAFCLYGLAIAQVLQRKANQKEGAAN